MKTPKFDMAFNELKLQCEEGKFDTEYADFIDSHADSSEVMICNGQSLIMAMESGYLFDDFVDHLWAMKFKTVLSSIVTK